MLNAFACDTHKLRRMTSVADPAGLRNGAWIDLVSPTDQEVRSVESATGLSLPSKADLSEIESSSRLSIEDGVFTLSMPLVSRVGDEPRALPCGFVLARDRLITIRYGASRAFDAFIERETKSATPDRSGPHLFVGLLEAIVDRQADVLEQVRTDLDELSRRIFRQGGAKLSGGKHEDRMLRETLAQIGRAGEMISNIRDSQVGGGRIVPYVQAMAKDWLPEDLTPRLAALSQDIASLNDFDTHLNDKLQFLLDATLGFINIAQNNVMKVLTVASVVGIPPVLIAGIYGMNFKSMPELDWPWGYAYGLTVIAVSALVPLIWFKLRDWI
jgi:magnesium transporter